MVDSLTGNEVKSLLGLDDITLAYGDRNFEKMRETAKKLCRVANVSLDEQTKLLAEIDEVELFHKCDFMRHLGTSTAHCCGCLECGLHCATDATTCDRRGGETPHEGTCTECARGFSLFPCLRDLQERAAAQLNLTKLEVADIKEIEFEIDDLHKNYCDFRSHQGLYISLPIGLISLFAAAYLCSVALLSLLRVECTTPSKVK